MYEERINPKIRRKVGIVTALIFALTLGTLCHFILPKIDSAFTTDKNKMTATYFKRGVNKRVQMTVPEAEMLKLNSTGWTLLLALIGGGLGWIVSADIARSVDAREKLRKLQQNRVRH